MIVMMVMIFWFSADTGEESSAKSDGIAEYIWEIADYFHIDIEAGEKLYSTVTFLIRKAAHMTEYAILAVLIFMGIYLDIRKLPKWYWVIAIGIFYAATDELHQLFVPGRSGQLLDVCIDSVGVVMGFFVTNKIVKKCRRQ